VHQRILLAKKRGADIHIAHGAAPHSDMKNFGKKRSPNSRKRGQARVYERHRFERWLSRSFAVIIED